MDLLTLDLQTAQQYLQSLALLRQQISLTRSVNHDGMVELNLQLYGGGTASVFMRVSDLYIVAFRGQDDVIYELGDTVQAMATIPGEVTKRLGLKSDHRSLGTFDETAFRIFDMQIYCENLNRYREGMPYESIRKGLALLVCMLAEGARFLEVQNEFAGVERRRGEYWARIHRDKGIYNEQNEVVASEIVNYWAIGTRARSVFSGTGLPWRTAHEIAKTLNSKLSSAIDLLKSNNVRTPPSDILGCAITSTGSLMSIARSDPRFATLLTDIGNTAKQLKINNPESAGETLRLLSSELALRAANNLLIPMC